ncbi:MAG: hypothetical protein AAFV46_00120 [Cyanobacteria bacterium J06635_11]
MAPPNDIPRPIQRTDGVWLPKPTYKYVAEQLRLWPDYADLAEEAIREQHRAGQEQIDILDADILERDRIAAEHINALEQTILEQERTLPWWTWALIGAGAGAAAGIWAANALSW